MSGDGVEGSDNKPKPKLKLYNYWRSSCSHRVRIALNLKGIEYEYVPVNLLKGENHSPEFLKLNPVGYVPVLVDEDFVLGDSFAILMYLEEKYPQKPLLPADLGKRALNYQAANIVGSSIQPLMNLGVVKFVDEMCGANEHIGLVQYYITKGFTALEKLLKDRAGKYATGDEISLADVFLAAQIYGAVKKFNTDMAPYPTLSRLNEAYNENPAFIDALPSNQPDTPATTS
ncbi:hypothetical protein MLD38_038561 [Melastoma candidum]|uniref:Uncharacterized protein n=1 Tax=Melastoma candidum TaxID=119954 RepID=A0ACB9KZI7_9MYRT|nr:hypothetical protein MLD38_038561 [Melastoma candidum]